MQELERYSGTLAPTPPPETAGRKIRKPVFEKLFNWKLVVSPSIHMVSERVVGGLILGAFAIIAVVYSVVLWIPGANHYALFAVKLVTWILVVGVSAIAIWLGWVMVSTKPIVPEEKPADGGETPEQKPDSQGTGASAGSEHPASGTPPSAAGKPSDKT